MTLLHRDEPPAFDLIEGAGGASCIFVCDHASNRVPGTLGTMGIDARYLDDHIAWDIGAGAVARRLCERFEACAVLGNYSRLVIDLNRRLDDPTSIPEVADGIRIPANIGLSEADRAARIEAIHEPYHSAVDALIDRRTTSEHVPVFIGVHSFTPRFENRDRPWHVGVLWDIDGRLPQPLMEWLERAPGIVVGDNEPYSGRHPADFSIDHHAEPRGLAHTGIEIRQDLIEDAAGQEHWARVIGDALAHVLADRSLFTVRPDLEHGG